MGGHRLDTLESRHGRPSLNPSQIMVGSPHHSTRLRPPRPDVPISNLRNTERDVPAGLVQGVSHLSVNRLVGRPQRIQTAPVVFQKINAPGGEGVGVPLLKSLAAGKIVAS